MGNLLFIFVFIVVGALVMVTLGALQELARKMLDNRKSGKVRDNDKR